MPTAQEVAAAVLASPIQVRDPRAAKPDRTLSLAEAVAESFAQASQAARDAYAIRNTSEPDKGIGATISTLFRPQGRILTNIRLQVWAQKVLNTGIGAADMVNRTFRKVNSLSVPQPPDAPSPADDEPNGGQS